jgi:hypothetical protein
MSKLTTNQQNTEAEAPQLESAPIEAEAPQSNAADLAAEGLNESEGEAEAEAPLTFEAMLTAEKGSIGRTRIMGYYRAQSIDMSQTAVICATHGHDLPTEEEFVLYAPIDKKTTYFGMGKRDAKKNDPSPLALPSVKEKIEAMRKRYTKEKQTERAKLEKAKATAEAKEAKAKSAWESAKAKTAEADKKLSAFDASILGAEASFDVTDWAGRSIPIAVKLTADDIEAEARSAQSQKGAPKTDFAADAFWHVDRQFEAFPQKEGEGEGEALRLTVLALTNSGKRVRRIRIDALPSWYNGKLREREAYDMSPNGLCAPAEGLYKSKRNARDEFSLVEAEEGEAEEGA